MKTLNDVQKTEKWTGTVRIVLDVDVQADLPAGTRRPIAKNKLLDDAYEGAIVSLNYWQDNLIGMYLRDLQIQTNEE